MSYYFDFLFQTIVFKQLFEGKNTSDIWDRMKASAILELISKLSCKTTLPLDTLLYYKASERMTQV